MFNRSSNYAKKILISGAGIAGLALARQLKAIGIPFMLIEKRAALSPDGAGIALPANAVKALRYLGLGPAIDNQAHQVNKIIYSDSAGATLGEASLLEPPLNTDKFVALHRHAFHEILREGLDDNIHFNTTISNLTQTTNGVLVQFNHPHLPQEEFRAVIGADGINSAIRPWAFPRTNLTDLNVTIWRWTCKYPTNNLQPTYMLDASNLFMAYPIGKNEVYCYTHFFDPENLLSSSADPAKVLKQIFGNHGSIAKTLLEILPANQFIIPGRLRSIEKPIFTSGRIALIGDASHACSPMLQQGAGCALEDTIALTKLLEHFSTAEALLHYEKFRNERVNWISTSSDGPMKMCINMAPPMLTAVHQKVRQEGPLNVQGWRKLLATDPLTEIDEYIAECKQETTEVLTARL